MSIPTQQKALQLLSHAGSYSLADIPVPSAGPGEILVRVEAAAINPAEWKGRFIPEYAAFIKEYPVIQGLDVAGVVVKLGEGVTSFNNGDRVMHQGFFNKKLGGFQQYTAVSADLAAKIPDNFTFDQAAAIPLALMTAAAGLYQRREPSGFGGGLGLVAPWKTDGRGKYAGQPILIFGGASAVGQYAIQLARISGFSPIITTVSPNNNELVISLGATHALDRNLSPIALAEAVKKIAPVPLRWIYDAIASEETQDTAHDLLAPGGVLVVVNLKTTSKDKETSGKEVVFVFGSPHMETQRGLGVELYKHITKWFRSGELKPTSTEYIPGGLASIPDAVERLRSGQVGALKMIVHPQENVDNV